jgi:hypothetical protein
MGRPSIGGGDRAQKRVHSTLNLLLEGHLLEGGGSVRLMRLKRLNSPQGQVAELARAGVFVRNERNLRNDSRAPLHFSVMSAVVGGGRVRFEYPTLRKEREGWGTRRLVAAIDPKSAHSTPNLLPEVRLLEGGGKCAPYAP